ncbi:MAG: phosphotransferase [Gammaproteobacteria bacterium]
MTPREAALRAWTHGIFLTDSYTLAPASSDASVRRYFRIRLPGTSYIVMDAPPAAIDSRPFIAIAAALIDLGLNAPRVLDADLDQGFLLLTDLGERQYLAELHDTSVERLYGDALTALLRLQLAGDPRRAALPDYDEAFVRRELEIFRDWFLLRYLRLDLSAAEQDALDAAVAALAANALEQPRVWMHRDYHSRNLMLTERNNPGILDFQDSVCGPVSYDLVSLLKDCYVAWPHARVEAWALAHRARLQAAGFRGIEDSLRFLRWFDLMGAQRHLKAAGIFARLHLRDGKPGYLPDIPRTLGYVVDVGGRYSELAELGRLLKRWLPALDA